MDEKYSVWLEFPGYKAVVDELAAEAGNPAFQPHMTIAGSLSRPLPEVTTIVGKIAALLGPVTPDFTRFDTMYEEWRFFCLVSTKTRPLTNLFKSLHFAFPEASREHFKSWPHVSLLYGTPAAEKLWPEPVSALSARYGTRLFGKRPSNRLAVWETSGPVETWRRQGWFELEDT